MVYACMQAGGGARQAPVAAVGMKRFPRGQPVVMALGLLCEVMRLLCLALPILLLDPTLCLCLSCMMTG